MCGWVRGPQQPAGHPGGCVLPPWITGVSALVQHLLCTLRNDGTLQGYPGPGRSRLSQHYPTVECLAAFARPSPAVSPVRTLGSGGAVRLVQEYSFICALNKHRPSLMGLLGNADIVFTRQIV